MSDPQPRRSIRRIVLATMVALATTAALAPAAPATAKPAENWGFAYNDNPAPIGEYVMPKDRQWGSWKDFYPTDLATVSRAGITAGFYNVRFPRLGGKGIAHVTAVNKRAVWCQVGALRPTFEAELVQVRCYLTGGTPVDSAFTIAYTENKDSDGYYGWVHGNSDGTVANAYNSSGGTNSVGWGGGGTYKVWLQGLGSLTEIGNIQVTAENPARPVRCKPTNWVPHELGQLIYITCHDGMGVPVPSAWSLTFNHKSNLFGASNPPKLWGYLWDDAGVLSGPTNVNSQGGVNTMVDAGTGLRLATFPRIGYDPSHVQVTAFGEGEHGTYPDAFCNLNADWTVDYTGTARVRDVACYTGPGLPLPLPEKPNSFVSYTSAR
jgi:hypothetical protein